MLYEVEEINRFLSCPRCKKRFVEPKMLPCGETICEYCATEMLTERRGKVDLTFSCEICGSYHEIPKNGLPTSKIVLRLTEIKPSKISRGKLVDSLEANLRDIQLQIEELNYEVNHGDEKIISHCNNLKNDLKRSVQEKIKEINAINNDLMKQIDNYQRDCLNIFHTDIDTKENVNHLIKEMSLFHRTWDDYLKTYKINKKELRSAIYSAKEMENKFYNQREKLNMTIFNGKFLKFKKCRRQVGANLIGELRYQTDSAFFVEYLEKDDVKSLLVEFNQPSKKFTVEYLYKYPDEEKDI